MRRKKTEKRPKLKIVENILTWSELEPLFKNYIDKTVEFVTHSIVSAQISRIETRPEGVFVIYYKNSFIFRHGNWEFDQADEKELEVQTSRVTIYNKGNGTIQIKLNANAAVYLKQRNPRQLDKQKAEQ